MDRSAHGGTLSKRRQGRWKSDTISRRGSEPTMIYRLTLTTQRLLARPPQAVDSVVDLAAASITGKLATRDIVESGVSTSRMKFPPYGSCRKGGSAYHHGWSHDRRWSSRIVRSIGLLRAYAPTWVTAGTDDREGVLLFAFCFPGASVTN